jgi:hypothetical protein
MERQNDGREEEERTRAKGKNEELKIFLQKLIGTRLVKPSKFTQMSHPRLQSYYW